MKSRLFLATLVATIFATGCTTTQEATQLSSGTGGSVTLTGEEIKALVSGNTIEGVNTEGYYFKGYNGPDGKISATAEKGGKIFKNTGTWEIRGNTACAQWSNPDWKPVCATYAKSGEGFAVRTTSRDQPSIPVAKIVPGNPYNL